jgi:hypothetical protein
MPDEALEDAAPSEDTQLTAETEAPDTDTPSESTVDWETEDNPYRKRYGDLRSEFDSRNQRYSQYEQFVESLDTPEMQREMLRRWGYEVDDEDAPDLDPVDSLAQRLEAIEGNLQSRDQAQQQAELQSLKAEYVDESIKQFGSDLSDADTNLVRRLVKSGDYDDQDGIPDVEAIIKEVNGTWEQRQKNWRESKRARVPGGGPAARKQFDPTDEKARIEASTAAAQAAIDARSG